MPANLDPLLEAFAPGIGVVFGCLTLAVIGAVLAEGIIRAIWWLAVGRAEHRKANHDNLMRQIIREWGEDHDPPEKPPKPSGNPRIIDHPTDPMIS